MACVCFGPFGPLAFDFLAAVAATETDRISTSPMGLVRLWERS